MFRLQLIVIYWLSSPAHYKFIVQKGLRTHNISSWEVSDWILSGEGDGAEHDEHQDEVGEYVMIDEPVAKHTDPEEKKGKHSTDISMILCVCVYANVI